jgi:DNA-binding CsgD family transcriptional regulator
MPNIIHPWYLDQSTNFDLQDCGSVGVPLDPPLETPPANFEKVFEEAPEAMLLLGDDRAFLAGNRCARELLGVTEEELRGMRVDSRDGTEHDAVLSARADFEPGHHLAILRPVSPPRALEQGKLSAREREVLRMLASGATASEIAERLFLSRATVATHVRNAMVKLGAHTRIEAVVIALRNGEIGV